SASACFAASIWASVGFGGFAKEGDVETSNKEERMSAIFRAVVTFTLWLPGEMGVTFSAKGYGNHS
ncbi:MAG: hypothetical protein EBZ85_02760, partial [Actinobacteria bacterium]|nr:hypothetical protein [Actinomycetota bacterium]